MHFWGWSKPSSPPPLPQGEVFAGDASFDEGQVQRGTIAGISIAGPQAKTTLSQIRQLGTLTPLVYLPAHDAGTAARLAARQVSDFEMG